MAGVLVAIHVDSPVPLPAAARGPLPVPALLAAAFLLLRPRGVPSRLAADRWRTALALAACLLSGALLGARSAERSGAACSVGLARGTPIEAVGLVRTAGLRESSFGGGSSGRVEISPAELRAGRARCRLPALSVRTEPRGLPPPGAVVEVRGEWRPYASGDGPRRPEHRGSLRADELRLREGGGRTGARDSASARPGPSAVGPGGPAGVATTVRGIAARWRAAAGRRLEERLPPDAAALARALTLADRAGLPAGVARRFSRAGLAHVLAISGLHVGVLAAAASVLLGLWLPTGTRHVAAAAVTGVYVAGIGAPPSAVRASLLFAGWAVSRLRGRPIRTSDLLGLAAAVALVADPATALDAGFQLSFAGFGGVVLGAAAGRRFVEGRELGRGSRGVVLSVAAGAGACALTAPLTALHFQRAAPVAAASGLLGTPLVGLALPACLAALALPGWAAAPAAGAATGLLRLLTRAVEAFASVPGGHGPAAPPGVGYWLAAGLLLAGWVAYVRGGRAIRAAPPVAGAVLVALAWPAAAGTWTDLRTRGATLFCSLDVGQGDAAAVRTRRGHWLLLDAGPGPPHGRPGRDAGLSRVVPFLRSRGAAAVDLFLLSHPDLDHLGGAGAVFETFPVRRVGSSGAAVPGAPHLRFLERVDGEGAEWLTLRRGDRLRVDEVEVLVLDSGGGAGSAGSVDSNDSGLSLRISAGREFAWVTTGDASARREVAMMRRWPAESLRAELLSVGHHGSRTSTLPAWLEAVSPDVAVVSAGRGNRFGHPHPLTLHTLSEGDVDVRRTDRDGTVCVRVGRDGTWRVAG